MKRFGRIVAILILVVIAAYAALTLTEGKRAASARATLERAARQFVECYEQDASYARCDPGTSKVSVDFRSRRRFALSSSVEFGPTYSISRMGHGKLIRSCQPSGSRCPVGKWKV
jgi:Tfp pilus assembly protein PilE